MSDFDDNWSEDEYFDEYDDNDYADYPMDEDEDDDYYYEGDYYS